MKKPKNVYRDFFADLANHEQRDSFSDFIRREAFQNYIFETLGGIDRPANDVEVLDVGIGSGYLWGGFKGINLTGLDICEAAIKSCRTRKLPLKKLQRFDISSKDDWPVADNRFGLVVCISTLFYIRNPEPVITNLINKAARGGKIVVEIADAVENNRHESTAHVRQLGNNTMTEFFHPADLVEKFMSKANIVKKDASPVVESIEGYPATSMVKYTLEKL